MAKKKEMCSLENHEPGAGIVLMKLEELHSFEGHPFKVERNQELFELRCSIEKEGVLVPLLVRKISPETVCCFRAYFASFRASLLGIRMVRIFPFNETSARPCRTASTVIYRTSLTRIPVAQMVSISRASRSRPRAWASLVSLEMARGSPAVEMVKSRL